MGWYVPIIQVAPKISKESVTFSNLCDLKMTKQRWFTAIRVYTIHFLSPTMFACMIAAWVCMRLPQFNNQE